VITQRLHVNRLHRPTIQGKKHYHQAVKTELVYVL